MSPYGPLGAPDANGLMLPRMRLRRRTRRRLLRRRAPLTARLLAVAVMPSGRRLTAVRRIRVTR